MLDGWYLDDGRIWMHPALARNFLSCFDRCTAATGGRRNRGKTKIVFYMPQDEAQRHAQEWHLHELEELGEVSYLPEQITTLGAETGGTAEMRRQFLEKTAVVKTMLRKLPAIQDTQVEFVLQNACLSISKVAHLLRANGTELADAGVTDAWEAFDSAQKKALAGWPQA